MFSAFFAAYAVLRGDGGRAERRANCSTCGVAIETGLPADVELHLRPRRIARQARSQLWTQIGCWSPAFSASVSWPGVHEFAGLIAHGAGPKRSAFLSSFFALVGCHGLHVTAGLLWLHDDGAGFR